MEITLLSTGYDSENLIKVIEEIGPKHLILLTDEINSKEIDDCINIIINTFGRFIQIRKKEIQSLNLIENAKIISKIIEDESKKERSIVVSISYIKSEQNLGLLYGSISRYEFVDRIVCYSENHDLLDLPIFTYKLSDAKKELLNHISKGIDSADKLANLMNLSKGMIYHYVRELRNSGLLDKNSLKITSAGELAII